MRLTSTKVERSSDSKLHGFTKDDRVLLPALADFSGCNASESWAFARRLLANDLPAEATHVSFEPE